MNAPSSQHEGMNQGTGRRRRRPGGLAAAPAGIIALLAAACGGSPPAAGSSTPQQALAYAQCMRSHGDPGFPNPYNDGITGVISIGSPQQYLPANKACHKLLNDTGRYSPARQLVQFGAALNAAACMRSHGIPDYPDPSMGFFNGGVTQTISAVDTALAAAGLSPSSPQYQADSQACGEPLAPLVPPHGPGGTGDVPGGGS